MAHQKSYLCVGAPDMALDLIHRVCPVGHSAQMQPLKYHFILSEGSYDTRSNRKWEHTGGSSRSWCSFPLPHLCCHNLCSTTVSWNVFCHSFHLTSEDRKCSSQHVKNNFYNFNDVKEPSSVKKISPLPVTWHKSHLCLFWKWQAQNCNIESQLCNQMAEPYLSKTTSPKLMCLSVKNNNRILKN